MTTPLIEAIAASLEPLVNDGMAEPFKSAWLTDVAQAALTAITEAGYAVVPIDAVHALEASHIALDDWLHTYAPDECGEEYVQTTRGRIFEAGGTLAYIADLQQENRRILNMIRATNNGKAE